MVDHRPYLLYITLHHIPNLQELGRLHESSHTRWRPCEDDIPWQEGAELRYPGYNLIHSEHKLAGVGVLKQLFLLCIRMLYIRTCLICPFTVQDKLRLWGSPTSSLVTMAGPIGAKASMALPSSH